MRKPLAALTVSVAALGALMSSEGFRPDSYIPVPGDVPTIGYGTTEGVKLGQTVTREQAEALLKRDVERFDRQLAGCVKVPLSQGEFDAYTELIYNIGAGNFCGSTLVKRLNSGDYMAACEQILRWDRFKGKQLPGLTARRKREYDTCVRAQTAQ